MMKIIEVMDLNRPELTVYAELSERQHDVIPQLSHAPVQHPHNGDEEQDNNDNPGPNGAQNPDQRIGQNNADHAAAGKGVVGGSLV